MTHTIIIDDQQSSINVLGMLLEHAGVTFVSTTRTENIEDAIKMGGTPDIVFLDLELINATGLEILPQLRQHKQLAHARIIAYSIHTSEIGLVRKAGFDGFLGKPLDAATFPQLLSTLIAGNPVWID